MRAARRLVRHEFLLLTSLLWWALRRTPNTGDGTRHFGYQRGEGPMMLGLGFVCVVETVMMALLLRPWPTAHHVMLVVDLYSVGLVTAFHAACVVRPHVLDSSGGVLRVRRGAHLDLRVPLRAITAIRHERSVGPGGARGGAVDEALDVSVGAMTSLTLELAAPVTHVSFLGRRRPVRVVRFHANDPDALVSAVEAARSAALGGGADA
ncbi:hypothetical protein [Streptomyces sp. HSG2]|uniref:hypothetical protein n=1 Tax=Streptomyces sp. HSG2 TaxID=2797167 RepID=UPI00190438DB|nr:hypothetical protein [Streptomyces sp. HSG2]